MLGKKKKEPVQINHSLLNQIAPIGFQEKRNGIEIGENAGKIYGVIKYPQHVDYGWMSKLTNIPGTIVSIQFTPIESGIFVETISSNIKHSLLTAETAKEPIIRQRAEMAAKSGHKIMSRIEEDDESLGLLSTIVMPISTDDNVFRKICRKTESAFSVGKCKIRSFANLQLQGFRMLAPYYGTSDYENIIGKPVPLSSFLGGYPFASSGYNDGTGYYLAKDASGGLVIIDPWKRAGDRTNSCMVIMGVPGVGKSTAVKHIALSEYMKGTKIIFIDPEREYKELCRALEGDWINAGGGRGGRINPLEIRPVPQDDEDETDKLYQDEGQGMGDLALHLKTLEIFFNLYLPNLSDMQTAILKDSLIELYRNFGITWETDVSDFKSEDFPTFADLYQLIVQKAMKREEIRRDTEANPYTDLAMLLKDIAQGGDSFLWNGKSTIQANSRCICLDTHDLQNTSDKIKRTQYFNILTWCWQQMSADRNERVLLICDETYLMIDPNVPQSLAFLRNTEKRSRKYESGVAIISHSVVDFLSPEVKMYGQALLDVPCYKIIMGTDGKNLQETKELYNLTEAEEELLLSKKRGHALFMIGSKRLHVNFEIPEYKFEYMGKAGGR